MVNRQRGVLFHRVTEQMNRLFWRLLTGSSLTSGLGKFPRDPWEQVSMRDACLPPCLLLRGSHLGWDEEAGVLRESQVCLCSLNSFAAEMTTLKEQFCPSLPSLLTPQQQFSTGVVLLPRERVAMSRDIFHQHTWKRGGILVSSR